MPSSARNLRTQTERLEARVGPEQKSLFKRAADLRGETLTEFMVTSMREAAMKAIEEHELVLSLKEQEIFIDMLMNPPAANSALREAAEDYLRTVKR